MYDENIISEALNLNEQGYTQKEIAIKLGCGERTIRRWLSNIKTFESKTKEVLPEYQLNLSSLTNFFQDDYIPQILFFISMAVKNNKFKSISFVNDMNKSISKYDQITEPWLAAISGFNYLSEITGVQKFEEINCLIKNEKPFIKKDRKKFRRRINPLISELRLELITLFDISKIKLTDFKSNISTQSYSDIHQSNYLISDLNILAPNEQINQFLDSKYGLLLEIESRLPDLDNRLRKVIYDLQKIPLRKRLSVNISLSLGLYSVCNYEHKQKPDSTLPIYDFSCFWNYNSPHFGWLVEGFPKRKGIAVDDRNCYDDCFGDKRNSNSG